jgi:hypothetical protein
MRAAIALLMVGCSTVASVTPTDAGPCEHFPRYTASGWHPLYCADSSAEYFAREDAFFEAAERLGCCLPSCCGVECHATVSEYAEADSCATLDALRSR